MSSIYAAEIYANDDNQIKVYVDGVLKALGDDYVLNGLGSSAGISVVATFPLSSAVFIERVTPIKQEVDTQNNETILEEVLDIGLDKLTLMIQERAGETARAVLVPRGEEGFTLGDALTRANFFLAFGPTGDIVYLSGTGTDAALRTDLGNGGPPIIGYKASGANALLQALQSVLQRERSIADQAGAPQLALTRSLAEGTAVSLVPKGVHAFTDYALLPNGADVDGKHATVRGATPVDLLRFAANGQGFYLDKIVLDGTDQPGPAGTGDNWGAGPAKGSAGYFAGNAVGDRAKGFYFGDVFAKNFKNGVFNWAYTDDVAVRFFRADKVQTAVTSVPGYVPAHVFGLYYCNGFTGGDFVITDLQFKGLDLGYTLNATVNSVRTQGGNVDNSAIHTVGGERVYFGVHVHDGTDTGGVVRNGYPFKAVNASQFVLNTAIYRRGQGGVQNYGSDLYVGHQTSFDTIGTAIDIDAYQTRIQNPAGTVRHVHNSARLLRSDTPNDTTKRGVSIRADDWFQNTFTGTGAQTVFVVSGGTTVAQGAANFAQAADLRAYVDGVSVAINSAVGTNVTLAAAPENGASVVIRDVIRSGPIEKVELRNMEVSGGWSGIYTPYINGQCDLLRVRQADIEKMAATGYPIFLGAKYIELFDIELWPGLVNGILLYTNPSYPGGHCIVDGLTVHPGISSAEPILRLGYPSAANFQRAAFKQIQIGRIMADGGMGGNTRLLDINAQWTDHLQRLDIHDVSGVNFALAEQIKIRLPAVQAQAAITTLSNIGVFNNAGAKCTLDFDDGVTGNVYQAGVHMTVTGI